MDDHRPLYPALEDTTVHPCVCSLVFPTRQLLLSHCDLAFYRSLDGYDPDHHTFNIHTWLVAVNRMDDREMMSELAAWSALDAQVRLIEGRDSGHPS